MLDTFLVNEMARSLIRQSSWRSVNWDDCAYEFWWQLDFVTTSYAKFLIFEYFAVWTDEILIFHVIGKKLSSLHM